MDKWEFKQAQWHGSEVKRLSCWRLGRGDRQEITIESLDNGNIGIEMYNVSLDPTGYNDIEDIAEMGFDRQEIVVLHQLLGYWLEHGELPSEMEGHSNE